jgi:lysozyme family protein
VATSPRAIRAGTHVAVAKLLGVEGGFVDDRADRGGATKYGISLRFLKAEGAIDANHDGFADFDLDMDGDIDGADIRNLTMSEAVALYHRCFWEPLACESFPEPIGEMLFDQA